jgi:hypothetical protein
VRPPTSRDRAEPGRCKIGLEHLERVEPEHDNAVAPAYAPVAQGTGEPANPFVELAVGAPDAVETETDLLPARTGVPGELVAHRHAAAQQAGHSGIRSKHGHRGVE